MKYISLFIFLFIFQMSFNPIFAQGKFTGGDGSGSASSTIMNQPLPVELIYFEGAILDKSVVLKWKVGNEIRHESYTIEKSVDAENFTILGQIDNDNNTFLNDYKMIDDNPFEGINYYRLKQKDIDGKLTYSDIVAVYLHLSPSVFSFYPNPFVNELRIDTNLKDRRQNIRVFNVLGEIVYFSDYIAPIIYLETLQAGIYFVEINGASVKLVKK